MTTPDRPTGTTEETTMTTCPGCGLPHNVPRCVRDGAATCSCCADIERAERQP